MRLPATLKTFLVRVEAKPGDDVIFDPSMQNSGYFQRLGVTAKSADELIELVRDYIKEDLGSSLVNIDGFSNPDFDGSDNDIKDLCTDINQIGIWYQSGYAFFDYDEEGEEIGDDEDDD